MNWLAVFYLGVPGWLIATKIVWFRCGWASWFGEWWRVGLLLVCLPALVVGSLMIMARGKSEILDFLGGVATDVHNEAMAISKRQCGKEKGWPYQLIKWACIAWFLPTLIALGEILPMSED